MEQLNFTPFPVLETELLILRKPALQDRQMLFEIRSNATTMQYIPRPMAKTIEDADALLEMINGFTDRNEKINWAITEKGNDTMIGMIGYPNFKPESHRAEVGYVMHHEHLRKGITIEALKAVVDYAFTVWKLHSIEAIICTENTASANLIEKAGFVREALFRDYVYHRDRYWDEYVYSLITPFA